MGGEELLRRLRAGELTEDVDRLRSKLERWRDAPDHSPEWIKAKDHDRAIKTLLLWESMRST